MADDSHERRQAIRYPANWQGFLPRTGKKGGPFRVVDASETGLFIAMEVLPKMGTHLIIEVIIGGQAVMVAGNIVRHMTTPDGAPMPSGVGLELTRKPDNWKDLISLLGGGNTGRPTTTASIQDPE